MPRFASLLSAGIAATLLAGACALTLTPAAAATMSDADKAALKAATASCTAQVKEEAKFNEMSWYAKHKAIKKCVKDTLAKH